jgi:thiamine pyrophosphokinase
MSSLWGLSAIFLSHYPFHSDMARRLRRVMLLCNGEPPSRRLARGLSRQADLVIAADGGANTARALDVTPHIIIGDLDSITTATRRHFVRSNIIRVSRQDNTDLEKALDVIADGGKADVMILGATGNRIDFTLANLAVIWNYTPRLMLTIRGEDWRAFPVQGRAVITAPRGTVVSLIPFGVCSGITIRGMQFPLRNASMKVGEVGVSNVVIARRAVVTVRNGRMLAVVFEGRTRKGRVMPW